MGTLNLIKQASQIVTTACTTTWRSSFVVGIRHAARWSWLLFLYFLIGGGVFTTIGAFQYQETLFKELQEESSSTAIQARLSEFRQDYERHAGVTGKRDDLLEDIRGGLEDAEKAQIDVLADPLLQDNPPPSLKAPANAADTKASETSKTAKLLVEAALASQQKYDKALNDTDFAPLRQIDLHNLLYLQNLAWMVPFGPQPITLATMPPGLLTFIITLAMGALGSLLYVTKFCLRSVIDGQAQVAKSSPFVRPLSWFVFRPLLGMMTAMVIFIFVKAGQFSFSDASLSAALESGLNPYLISFLAILSGFMSWQAIDAIERSGKKLFGWQANRDRWAYGLRRALNMKPAVTEKSLADDLDVSTAQVEKWIAGEQQVNHRQQERIAQVLGMTGKDARMLFTDIPADGLSTST